MTITPEQFLAMPSDPEDDQEPEHVEPQPSNPLESIASNLGLIASIVSRSYHQEQADDEAQQRYDDLDQAFADLEAKHDVLRALVEEIEGIVKPSTSKLANQVREAIRWWRNPPQPEAAEPSADVVPADDAPVEEWRAYARNCGHGRTGPAFNELEAMNRSQIRTMLGIDQPVSEVSA